MPDNLMFELVFLQRLGGGMEVLERNIPAADALARLQKADQQDFGPGGITFLRPEGGMEPDEPATSTPVSEHAWQRLREFIAHVVVDDQMIMATLLMGRTQESLEGYIAGVRELVRMAVAVERERAESEAAALRAALTDIEQWCQSLIDQTDTIDPAWVVQRAAIVRDLDAGRLFLAELGASRALIGTLKEVLAGQTSTSALRIAMATYERAVKARQEPQQP